LRAIDDAARSAVGMIADGNADQEAKESAIARAKVCLTDHLEDCDRLRAQIDAGFPAEIANGQPGSFAAVVWTAMVRHCYAAAVYAFHDLADEVRYSMVERKTLADTSFARDWLEDAEARIDCGAMRIRRLHGAATLFDQAGAGFDEAARKIEKAGEALCRYMAARARSNAAAIRDELVDVADGQRRYGGFCKPSIALAADLVRQQEQSIAHISGEARRSRRLKDIRALVRLQPHDHRPVRNGMYEAVRAGDVAAVRELLPMLAAAMGCNEEDVFATVPPRARQTLPLREEPALQDALARVPELAKLADRSGSKPAKLLVLAAAFAVGLSTLLFTALDRPGHGGASPQMAARPGTERVELVIPRSEGGYRAGWTILALRPGSERPG